MSIRICPLITRQTPAITNFNTLLIQAFKTTIFLGLLIGSSANVFSQTTYQYTKISHRLLTTSNSSKASADYGYIISGKAQLIGNSFKTSSGTKADTNNYKLDSISGLMIEHWDTHHNALFYQYDIDGLSKINYASTFSGSALHINYVHNAFGEVIEIKRSPGLNTYNIYGANSRLDEIFFAKTNNVAVAKEVWVYHYGVGGNLLKVSLKSNTKYSKGNLSRQYTYNDHNQLIQFNVLHNSSLSPADVFGNAIKSRSYTYGLNSNINAVNTTYSGKLQNAKVQMQYQYNSTAGEPNQLQQIITIAAPQNQYNNAKFQAEITAETGLSHHAYQYNPYGALTKDPEGDTYQYNNSNQMTQGKSPTGSEQTYAYGTNGLLAYEKSYLSNLGPGLRRDDGKAVYFSYAGGTQPAEQLQGTTNSFYLHGLATFTASGRTQRPAPTWLYEVAQGNVAMTSNNNGINNQYLYTPYGQQTNLHNPTEIHLSKLLKYSYAKLINQTRKPLDITKNQFGYTGQQKDPSTGLMMLGNFRNYAPSIARFIQPDTYNSFEGVDNTDAYVKGNPVAANDPSGHGPDDGDDESFVMPKGGPEELFQQYLLALRVVEKEKQFQFMNKVPNSEDKMQRNGGAQSSAAADNGSSAPLIEPRNQLLLEPRLEYGINDEANADINVSRRNGGGPLNDLGKSEDIWQSVIYCKPAKIYQEFKITETNYLLELKDDYWLFRDREYSSFLLKKNNEVAKLELAYSHEQWLDAEPTADSQPRANSKFSVEERHSRWLEAEPTRWPLIKGLVFVVVTFGGTGAAIGLGIKYQN